MIGVSSSVSSVAALRRGAVASVAVPHRYWRFYVTAIQTAGSRAAVSELVFKTSAGGTQAASTGAPGVTITDSSNFGGFTGGSCFNGLVSNSNDGWISNLTDPGPDWVKIDYGVGNAKSIVEYTVYNAHGSFMPVGSSPKTWQLQYSDDNSAWTVADSQTGIVWAGSSLNKTYTVA